MTQTQEFDPHVAIRQLAEAEIQPPLNVALGDDMVVNLETGRIVPFASLRTECYFCGNSGKVGSGLPDPNDELGVKWVDHDACEGRGFLPEPDTERACWRIYCIIADLKDIVRWQPHYAGRGDMQEAVLRAALAWVKEQQGRR